LDSIAILLLVSAVQVNPAQAPAQSAVRSAGAAQPLFAEEEIAHSATVCGSPEKKYIIEVNGGGLALEDFDGDGDIDLFLVDGSTLAAVAAGEPGRPPRLFLNDGGGHFEPADEAWTLGGGRWGMGVAAGDLNGDRHPDLVITQWGAPRVVLNRGGAGFEEISERAGLSGERWGTSAALLDYDRDGALDLAIANYLAFDAAEIAAPGGPHACRWKGYEVMCGPEGLSPVHDQLYRGRGDGTFEDATLAAGYRPEQAGFGLGLMTLDYDADGDTDLYVANDSTPNHLWENRGDGTFAEVGFERSVSHDAGGHEQASMGIGCADLNADGRPDLLVSNFSGEGNALYLSRGALGFRERSSAAGIGGASMTTLGWGALLEDFDLDGRVDAAVMNGHVYPQADNSGTDTSYAQPNHLFRGVEGERFGWEPLSDGPPRVSRAAAAADVDGDGDLDIAVLELGGPVHLLRNRARSGPAAGAPHWLRVRLVGRGGNGAGLGARVTAEWSGGARHLELRTAGGFQASVPAEVHVGLGSAERLTRLVVRWPSGKEQVLEDLAADRVLSIEESE
jgi:hypothetical protein